MFGPGALAPHALRLFSRLPAAGPCWLLGAAIDRLDLDVKLRDVRVESRHWDELVAARGRGTVPVLKIEAADGAERWMPGSADIIRYLDKAYG